MSKRIVMGYWDCSQCGNKKIKGTQRSCPNCGFVRDKHTKFYISGEVEYLSEKEAEIKGKGPDWICPYCGKLNSVTVDSCTGCGSLKNESEQDYFSAHKGERDINNGVPCKNTKSKTQKPVSEGSFINWINEYWWVLLSVLLSIFLIFGIVWMIMPKQVELTVTGERWERTIEIEEYKTVEENDWSIPPGGREKYTKNEIHHYDKVLDHYETKTRTYTEQVYDGQETYYTYSNNGDGTFSEQSHTRPKYRTAVKTETYQDPVYRSVPVYQTKYYYEIERWVYKESVKSSGSGKTPYWAELNLQENEREGDRSEKYFISGTDEDGKESEYEAGYDIWVQMEKNQTYQLKVNNSCVLEILN